MRSRPRTWLRPHLVQAVWSLAVLGLGRLALAQGASPQPAQGPRRWCTRQFVLRQRSDRRQSCPPGSCCACVATCTHGVRADSCCASTATHAGCVQADTVCASTAAGGVRADSCRAGASNGAGGALPRCASTATRAGCVQAGTVCANATGPASGGHPGSCHANATNDAGSVQADAVCASATSASAGCEPANTSCASQATGTDSDRRAQPASSTRRT